jgi:hypothetical protein
MKAAAAAVAVSSLVVVLVGCSDSSAPSGNLRYSAWVMGCGAADGPATWITLSRNPLPAIDPTYPYVAITIERPLSQLQGSWTVGNGATAAGASYIMPAQTQTATFGRVTITAVDADSTIHGLVDLWFPAQRVNSELHAAWLHRAALCG